MRLKRLFFFVSSVEGHGIFYFLGCDICSDSGQRQIHKRKDESLLCSCVVSALVHRATNITMFYSLTLRTVVCLASLYMDKHK